MTDKIVVFTVYGTPLPQGNKSALPYRRKDGTMGVNVVEGRRPKSRNAFKAWRKEVSRIAWESVSGDSPVFDEPVKVVLRFFLPRPKSLPKKEWAPRKKPDVDKLTRAVFDACSGVVFKDDSQVIHVEATKQYARPGDERVEVWMCALPNPCVP